MKLDIQYCLGGGHPLTQNPYAEANCGMALGLQHLSM